MVNRNLQRPLHKGQRCSCAVVYLTFLLHAKTNNLLLLYSEDTLFAKIRNQKTIIPLGLVGYEMIIATSLAIYHLISNAPSWNNCLIYAIYTIRMWTELTM